MLIFFFCKLKTAYEFRIRYWSSDVCSSDLLVQTQYPGVTNDLFDALLLDVTVSAMHLDGERSEIESGIGAERLDQRRRQIDPVRCGLPRVDRKSTRLNSSH